MSKFSFFQLVFSHCFRYEACWKAIMHEADGVILVYNPDAPGQDQQLNDWFEFFVKKNGLRDDQCLIFAHRVNPTNERFRPRKFGHCDFKSPPLVILIFSYYFQHNFFRELPQLLQV